MTVKRAPQLRRQLAFGIAFVAAVFTLMWGLAVLADSGVGDLDLDDISDRSTCAIVEGRAQFTSSVTRNELSDSAVALEVSVEFADGGFPLELVQGTFDVGGLEGSDTVDIVIDGPAGSGGVSCRVADARVS